MTGPADALVHRRTSRPGVPRVKTAVPRLPGRHVYRPRLTAALEAAASGQVTLVSAPAGYGKTLLLAEWAARRPELTGWMSLDADDNDDSRFWSAVLTAVASCPAVPEDNPVHRLVVPARPSQDPTFLAAVVEAVDLVPEPIRLVLDDVHELTAADPVHGLASLVRDRPPGLHLVLGGRSDPPLPLGRMRLAGQLCEIRAEALRFSMPEADALVTATDVRLDPDQLRRLVDQTAGWAAGLRLAALSLRETDDVDRFLADFAGNSRAVADYLVGEILERLPAPALDLLRAVSVCDPLSAPLAAALSDRPDAGEILDGLEHDTSLILSSGRGRLWYRVHPLLRSHLLADLRRRRPDLVLDLHRRAADWFAAREDAVPALAHARRAGDSDLLSALLRRNTVKLIADGAHRALREALDGLGGRAVADDPWYSLVAALVDIETGALTAADAHLDRARATWPARAGPELTGLDALVRTRRVSLDGDPHRILRVTESLDPEPAGTLGLAVMGKLDRALALLIADRVDEARDVAAGAVAQARQLDQAYLAARGLTVLAAVEAAHGQFQGMVELARQADEVVPGTDWQATAGAVLSTLLRAYGALLRAEPAACLEILGPALAFGDPHRGGPLGSVSTTARALRGAACVDLGSTGEGLQSLRHARGETVGRPRVTTTTALLAALEYPAAALSGRGDVARTVLEWAEHELGSAGEVALMRAQRLTAMGRLPAAADALHPVLTGSLPPVLPWTVIDAHVLDCSHAVLGGRRHRARAALERALALTEQMDVLRPLAFCPDEVAELLTGLLGSFDGREQIARRVLRARFALRGGDRRVGLTERERAVLTLLPTQRSFGEIAAELTVSHSTVKTHVRAIYTKLGAGSRREAVDRARTRGLISPETS
ncbi:LuxR C-terminal-related transcriptional regulator [Trujillonella endophytica]|uniref:LuxR C-terminal-related transcriptional regulator n=1 Tax=Trujillonella endophytica TaxID=673521 RepID=UPI0014801B75|nr:LuxR C-terminal-related transcriptional regulator [Trujillella endophytica]